MEVTEFMTNQWWRKQLRIVQYNLQTKDTPLMDAAKIARETEMMKGNAVVINVADSVVWYRTAAPHHKINEFLPEDRDILEEIVNECHKRDIKVFARGTFLCMEEEVYYQKPQWALRRTDGSPVTLGNDRPGLWHTLYRCCPNSGFSNESGMNVMMEAFGKYDLDGAFIMMGSFGPECWCDVCKRKYREKYGKPMPEEKSLFESDWLISQAKDTHLALKDTLLKMKPDMPYLRYYWPFDLDIGIGTTLPADNIESMSEEGNTLCTEAQDVLSMGAQNLPEWNAPALRMKMGRTVEDFPPPVGIIHTCPGMDWRHACMPEAEFLYWAAQIPANGGSYWTTFTGFSDTISDKRMLRTVGAFNAMTEKITGDMEGAKSVCEVMLLSDGGIYVQGWAEALMCAHIDFDMLAHYQLNYDRIKKYPVVIVPKGFKYPEGSRDIFEKYVAGGGKLIAEGTTDAELAEVKGLLGVRDTIVCSEDLETTYLQIEPAGQEIQDKIGEAGLIPLRGKVGFCEPREGTKVLATWVPPFATVATAGMPPERASLPIAHTDLPLCMVSDYKKGKVMFIPYEPSRLIREYALDDMFTMIRGYVEYMLGDDKKIALYAPKRIILSVFGKEDVLMLHLVNGIGQRPLQDTVPCYHIKAEIKLSGRKVKTVVSRIAQCGVDFTVDGDLLSVNLERLDTWDMLLIKFA